MGFYSLESMVRCPMISIVMNCVCVLLFWILFLYLPMDTYILVNFFLQGSNFSEKGGKVMYQTHWLLTRRINCFGISWNADVDEVLSKSRYELLLAVTWFPVNKNKYSTMSVTSSVQKNRRSYEKKRSLVHK